MRDTSELFWEAQELLRGDREAARRRLEDEVAGGDENAKFQLAVVLIEWEPAEAVRLWSELDAAGVDGAAYHLGTLHWESDTEAAKHWYRRAISRDDFASGAAALGLGRLLYNEESPEAVQWLERAHDAGEEGAAFWLAACLVSTDPDKALELYRCAIDEGEAKAYYGLGWLLHTKGDNDEARRAFQAGADLGDRRCLSALVDSWIKDDPREAFRWFVRWIRSGGLLDLRLPWRRRRFSSSRKGP
ncbi:MAG TPA: hypothetical protein VFH56_04105 [Acidimicrobiales bacterium]|nr:hypothetical protein [Acidimicrobiales bacterium]